MGPPAPIFGTRARGGIAMSLRDPIAAIVVFAFSTTAFVLAGNYSGGAGTFPRGIAAIMMICSVILFVRGLFWPTEGERMTPDEMRRVGISMALTIAYVALIVPLGFFTASIIYIPLAAYVLGLRRHLLIWGATAIYMAGVYYLFVRIFYTPLPRELIFRFL